LSTRDDVANGFCVHELLVIFSNSRPIGYYYVMLALLKSGRPIPFGHNFTDLAAGGASYYQEPNGDMTKSCPGPGFYRSQKEASSVSERLGR